MFNMQHHYHTEIRWTGNKGSGTSSYTDYERSHDLIISNKPSLSMSSDTPFRGDGSKQNPEDLLLASLSSCHLLWYLHLCADAGVIVLDYCDKASAIMETGNDKPGHFVEVVLRPQVTVQSEAMVESAMRLHAKAHEQCFIANSVNFPVHREPEILIR